MGRLLITFLLVYRGVLHRPLLYLSLYLKRHRAEYYDRLMAIREEGDWEGWLRFFLKGVVETAREATTTASAIVTMRERHRELIEHHGVGINGFRLLEALCTRPLIHVNAARDLLDVHYNTASKLIERFGELGLLEEITGKRRGRVFSYEPYLDLFRDERPIQDRPVETEPSASPQLLGSAG